MVDEVKVGDVVDFYDTWDHKWIRVTLTYLDETKVGYKRDDGAQVEEENSAGWDDLIVPAGQGSGTPDQYKPIEPPKPRPDHKDPATPQIAAAQQRGGADVTQLRAEEILALINEYRATQGAGPLTMDPNLQLAAQNYANTLKEQGGRGHGVGGTTVPQRIEQACKEHSVAYVQGGYGENCAYGYPSEPSAIKGWQESPGHNGNMLSPGWTRIGVGVSTRGEGGFNWVTVFG